MFDLYGSNGLMAALNDTINAIKIYVHAAYW